MEYELMKGGELNLRTVDGLGKGFFPQGGVLVAHDLDILLRVLEISVQASTFVVKHGLEDGHLPLVGEL